MGYIDNVVSYNTFSALHPCTARTQKQCLVKLAGDARSEVFMAVKIEVKSLQGEDGGSKVLSNAGILPQH
jgi:hypothetical protein